MSAIEIALNPDYQLDLPARKMLAARLLSLIRRARMAQEEKPTSPQADGFIEIMDVQIGVCLKEDEASDEPASLIKYLANVAKRVDETTSNSDEASVAASEALHDETKLFDCAICGQHNKKSSLVCNDGVIDRKLFADPDGGKCLRFLSDMILSFAREADRHYRALAGDAAPATILPRMVIETHRKNGVGGTLPIDGEFVQPNGKLDAIVRVFWPIDEQLDDAILSLPYLVFHEVFVHGAQGAGRKGARFKVHDNCAFTEGTVDAVSCEVLLKEVLANRETLPEPIQDLAGYFYDACNDYHAKRFESLPRGYALDFPKPGDKIRDARRQGRSVILRFLQGIQTKCHRFPNWAHRVVLLLNLYLDGEERRNLFKLIKTLSGHEQSKILCADPLDRFLEDHDTHALLLRLRKLKG